MRTYNPLFYDYVKKVGCALPSVSSGKGLTDGLQFLLSGFKKSRKEKLIMAIFHFTVSVRSRAKGSSSSVAGSAYLSGQQRKDEREGRSWNFAHKDEEVLHHEVLLPESAPEEWKQKAARGEHDKVANTLWNSVEAAEKQSNAQVCRNFEWALPNELSLQDQEELVREYIQKNFVDQGMCFEYSICKKIGENGQLNMHVHGQATLRRIKEDGSWESKIQKQYLCRDSLGNDRYMRPDELKQYPDFEKVYKYKVDNKIVEWTLRQAEKHLKEKKMNVEPKILKKELKAMRVSKYALYTNIDTVDWNKKEKVEEWRSSWAEHANRYLEKFDKKIDHRSYERQGINQIPTIHEGYVARTIVKNGGVSDRIKINRDIEEKNKIISSIANELRTISNQISRYMKEKAAELTKQMKSNLKLVWERLKEPYFVIQLKPGQIQKSTFYLQNKELELKSLGFFDKARKKAIREDIEHIHNSIVKDTEDLNKSNIEIDSILLETPEIKPFYEHAKNNMAKYKANPYKLREFDEVQYSKQIYDLGVTDQRSNEEMVKKYKQGDSDRTQIYDLACYSRNSQVVTDAVITLDEQGMLNRGDTKLYKQITLLLRQFDNRLEPGMKQKLQEFAQKTRPFTLEERKQQVRERYTYEQQIKKTQHQPIKRKKRSRELER